MSHAKQLFEKAKLARDNAYAPYSKFLVGCAFVTKSGNLYEGVNFENLSFGATICAERTAVGTAITSGEEKRNHKFIQELVVVTQTKSPAPPCGMCLQVLSEFCEAETLIHLANLDGILKSLMFKEFMPHQFEKITD